MRILADASDDGHSPSSSQGYPLCPLAPFTSARFIAESLEQLPRRCVTNVGGPRTQYTRYVCMDACMSLKLQMNASLSASSCSAVSSHYVAPQKFGPAAPPSACQSRRETHAGRCSRRKKEASVSSVGVQDHSSTEARIAACMTILTQTRQVFFTFFLLLFLAIFFFYFSGEREHRKPPSPP